MSGNIVGCRTCRWYRANNREDSRAGICTIRSPQVSREGREARRDAVMVSNAPFPMRWEYDLCGEWEASDE